jgi:uncharacterized protein (DUF1684 family)
VCNEYEVEVEMTELEELRKHKDEFFGSDPDSPLSKEQKRAFKGLRYFPENPALRFDAEVEPFDEHKHVQMQTSTGAVQEYIKYGTFQFEVDGKPAELTVYVSPDGGDAFVPFVDATSGSETYGAGRYLDLHYHGGRQFHVDFNLAYNPWCAYSPRYSCPIPPQENRIQVPIRAGEKDFHEGEGAEGRIMSKVSAGHS